MKLKYEIIDSSFNRANYQDLIGQIVDTPPAYAQVKLIKEKTPMKDIFKLQSRMFEEEEAEDMAEDFVLKCLRAGYGQEDIVKGIQEFYHQAPEVGRQIFTRAVVKFKNLHQSGQPKKALVNMLNWYKKAQNDSNWTSEERDVLETYSDAVSGLERSNRNVKVHVIQNIIGNNTLHFAIESEYTVSTQLEPMQDRFTNSLYVEKVAPDYFEVNINEQGFRVYNGFETVKNIIQSFPL